MTFHQLGLEPELCRAVADEGYEQPTPVQAESIPLVLAGRDLLAGAQTGTGKTAAFVLPILQRLSRQATGGGPGGPRPVRALVLAPTRELALQVEEAVRVYGRHRPVRSVAIYGGVGLEGQARSLRAGPPIVVATPGRLLDHAGRGAIDLSRVEVLVLDEADRMLDMGFIRDIRRIIGLLPAARQNLLFSATFSDEIRTLANGILRDPATVQVAARNTAAELVDQLVIPVDRHRKLELLTHLVRSGRISQALLFVRTKHGANRLADGLARAGISAAAIHGNKSQGARVRALDDFKAGRVDLLVATEVAARGIDIDGLPFVVNVELPMVAADYVHRIGRTGRAGATGRAVSLVCVDEAGLLREIERLLRRPIPAEVVAGFEPDRSARPEPLRARGGAPRQAGGMRGGAPRQSGVAPRQGGGAPRPGGSTPRHGGGAPRPGGMPRPAAPVARRGAPPAAGRRRPGRGWPEPRPASAPPARHGHVDRPLVAMPGERLSRTGSGPAPSNRHHAGRER
ncbi:MAG: hypothetical protein RL338_1281 [Chloroflexota bacterium]